jgi:hypothetical protein
MLPAASDCSEASGPPKGQMSLLKNSSFTTETHAIEGMI